MIRFLWTFYFERVNTVTHATSTEEKNAIVGGTLYLVATPIGNLADLSERALKVLAEVDFVAAEDTRNTGLLLSRFGISKPLVSYFEHNKRERGSVIAERLLGGESCALVTDAGTPAISDPGEDLVKLCAEKNIPVTSVPGCCAGITALTLSALPTRRFTFEGFLPAGGKERREALEFVKNERRTMVFYESPHRLRATLASFAETFGEDRAITICRELTKLNEEVLRTTIGEAVSLYESRDPRGEYVLVIAGSTETAKSSDFPKNPVEHVDLLMESGLSRMDAIKSAAKARGLSKSTFYQLLEKEKESK